MGVQKGDVDHCGHIERDRSDKTIVPQIPKDIEIVMFRGSKEVERSGGGGGSVLQEIEGGQSANRWGDCPVKSVMREIPIVIFMSDNAQTWIKKRSRGRQEGLSNYGRAGRGGRVAGEGGGNRSSQ